jgi:hypothetical protein
MSLYAVKNDNGEWMSLDGTQNGIWYSNNPTLFKDKSYAEAQSMGRIAHVVELVEAPEKVVVSEDEAKMLKEAVKDDNFGAGFISDYADEHFGDYGSLNRTHIQDRLMRAYVNGWTVEKPKLWNVKVPHTDDSFYYKIDDEFCNAALSTAVWFADEAKFTNVEIEKYDLTDCERVEVTDDEQ